MKWMFLPLRRYVDFQGRSRRLEFWMFFLFQFVVGIIFSFIALASFFPAIADVCDRAADGEFDDVYGSTGSLTCGSTTYDVPADIVLNTFLPMLGIWLVVFLIYWLVMLLPSLAVQIRRFHDQDKSGWMVLLNLIPFFGGLAVFVFMCLEGTRGPNSFGPDPKGGPDQTFR